MVIAMATRIIAGTTFHRQEEIPSFKAEKNLETNPFGGRARGGASIYSRENPIPRQSHTRTLPRCGSARELAFEPLVSVGGTVMRRSVPSCVFSLGFCPHHIPAPLSPLTRGRSKSAAVSWRSVGVRHFQ